MITSSVTHILAHSFENVNTPLNSQLPLFSDSMRHHNVSIHSNKKIVYIRGDTLQLGYGVSPSRRVLTPQLLLKRFDQVRDCLAYTVGLTVHQREAALYLLRLWAYYGNTYPKAAQVTADGGCSKATYWRTVARLRDLGLITIINRYIIRPHAQISNLYKFDRLLLILARYLAEHGVPFLQKWIQPYLAMTGSRFWPMMLIRSSPGPSPGPAVANSRGDK